MFLNYKQSSLTAIYIYYILPEILRIVTPLPVNMTTNKSEAGGRHSLQKFFTALMISGFFCFSSAIPAYAHHSFPVHYIADKLITVSGTVTKFRFANPHGIIFFTVIDKNGEEQKWKGETNSPNVLKRRGWTGESVRVGQKISITGWPARNGSFLVRVSSVTLPNGDVLIGQPARLPSGND